MRRDLNMERKSVELGVGIFLLVGLACLGYISFQLGDIPFWDRSNYEVYAKFSTVAGLKEKANVMMAGVQIGQVKKIGLKDGQAWLTISIDRNVKLEEDSIVSVKTMGLIGDKYISISPGGSDEYVKPGGTLQETQPPLDIENLLGRFVFGGMEKGENSK
jgi:phospholipid/cholesterol/gamma-HCH transport system substrate-binding protein